MASILDQYNASTADIGITGTSSSFAVPTSGVGPTQANLENWYAGQAWNTGLTADRPTGQVGPVPNAVIVATEKQKLANLISAKTGANASTIAAADATTLLKLAAAAGVSPSQQSAVAPNLTQKSGISVPMILLGVGALALFYFAMKNRS